MRRQAVPDDRDAATSTHKYHSLWDAAEPDLVNIRLFFLSWLISCVALESVLVGRGGVPDALRSKPTSRAAVLGRRQ
jgi:hypothetical protein